jgi:hypothetical protein
MEHEGVVSLSTYLSMSRYLEATKKKIDKNAKQRISKG